MRQSLDEKGLIKLTKKLHRAVAEAREEKKGSLPPRFSEEARADRDRKDFLSQPESCVHIVKKAYEKGWNGEKVIKKIVISSPVLIFSLSTQNPFLFFTT